MMLDQEYAEDALEGDAEAPVDVLSALDEMSRMPNIVPIVDEERRAEIATLVIRGLEIDEASREDWLERAKAGAALASQERKDKTYPWPGAANATHPVLLQASMQFNARALPAVLPDGDVVKVRVHGPDPQGAKAKRAARVAQYMSYQLRSKVQGWRQDMDALLARLPIEGHLFRKIYYDVPAGRCCAKLYSPAHIVVNEGCESLDRAPRVSELMELFPHEIENRIRLGLFESFEYKNATDESEDGEWSGDESAPQTFIQQYMRFDLDRDGYPEPYIAIVHRQSQKLVRLMTNFSAEDVRMAGNQVISIEPETYFVDYRFFPSLTGGYHGVGMAHMVGNTSELINSVLNQILDAGHMSALGGGFIGQGVNLGKGQVRFRPGEWKNVNASGDDIRKAMVPLAYPQPSPVLFQVLGLLIESAKEIGSINNMMTGQAAPANQPAATTLAMIEQGMQVFNAAFMRIFESLTQEFRILARINKLTLDPEIYARFVDERQPAEANMPQVPGQMPQMGGAPQMPQAPQMPGQMPQMMGPPAAPQIEPGNDFDMDDMDIEPIANPRAVTSMQELAKAQQLMELIPTGLINPQAAVKRMLRAGSHEDIEELMPQPDPQAQQRQAMIAQLMEQLQIEGAKASLQKTQAEAADRMASAEERKIGMIKTVAEAEAEEEGADFERYARQVELLAKERQDKIQMLDVLVRAEDGAERRRIERMAGITSDRGGA